MGVTCLTTRNQVENVYPIIENDRLYYILALNYSNTQFDLLLSLCNSSFNEKNFMKKRNHHIIMNKKVLCINKNNGSFEKIKFGNVFDNYLKKYSIHSYYELDGFLTVN